jgi:hypothetical protein
MFNKTSLLILITLLIACPQPTLMNPPSSNPASVNGVIDGWTYGARTLNAIGRISNSTNTTPLTETQIDATGAFNLTLPNPPSQVGPISFFDPTCTSIVQTPANVSGLFNSLNIYRGTSVAGVVVQGDTKPSTTGQPASGSKYLYRLFVDRDVTVNGSCTGANRPDESWNISLTRGWNTIMIEFTTTITQVSGIRVSSDPIPGSFKWFYSGTDPNPPSGSISNLHTQTTYCAQSTGLTTKFDFKFDILGKIIAYEVYVSDLDLTDTATTPQAAGNVQGPATSSFTVTDSRVVGTVTITPSTNDLPILGGIIGTVGLAPQAIVTLPATGKLWVRGKLADGGYTPYLKATDPMALSSDSSTCDPPVLNVP